MINNIYDTANFLQKALDGSWLRNKVISNNIAGENIPGFKRSSVNFEELLANALGDKDFKLTRTNDKHVCGIDKEENFQPRIIKHKNYSLRSDGNNVNINTEMAGLAKNSIYYDALVKEVADEYEKIKNVIDEGSKY
jgi:flagellar basal-body rod protein FlgB